MFRIALSYDKTTDTALIVFRQPEGGLSCISYSFHEQKFGHALNIAGKKGIRIHEAIPVRSYSPECVPFAFHSFLHSPSFALLLIDRNNDKCQWYFIQTPPFKEYGDPLGGLLLDGVFHDGQSFSFLMEDIYYHQGKSQCHAVSYRTDGRTMKDGVVSQISLIKAFPGEEPVQGGLINLPMEQPVHLVPYYVFCPQEEHGGGCLELQTFFNSDTVRKAILCEDSAYFHVMGAQEENGIVHVFFLKTLVKDRGEKYTQVYYARVHPQSNSVLRNQLIETIVGKVPVSLQLRPPLRNAFLLSADGQGESLLLWTEETKLFRARADVRNVGENGQFVLSKERQLWHITDRQGPILEGPIPLKDEEII